MLKYSLQQNIATYVGYMRDRSIDGTVSYMQLTSQSDDSKMTWHEVTFTITIYVTVGSKLQKCA